MQAIDGTSVGSHRWKRTDGLRTGKRDGRYPCRSFGIEHSQTLNVYHGRRDEKTSWCIVMTVACQECVPEHVMMTFDSKQSHWLRVFSFQRWHRTLTKKDNKFVFKRIDMHRKWCNVDATQKNLGKDKTTTRIERVH